MRNALLLLLVGCVWTPREGCSIELGGGGTSFGVVSTDVMVDDVIADSGSTICGVDVQQTWPEDAATGVSPDIVPSFYLNHYEKEIEVEATYSGNEAVEGDVLSFVPLVPFPPNTLQRVSLFYCQQFTNLEFTVGDFGDPLQTSSSDLSWSLDLAGARASTLWQSHFAASLNPLLIGSSWRLSPALDDGNQDTCVATQQATADNSASPRFSLSIERIALSLVSSDPLNPGAPIYLQNPSLNLISSSTGNEAFATLSGIVDLRELSQSFLTAEEICQQAPSLGSACIACADGVENCIPLILSDIHGVALSTPLLDVAADQCPGCEEGAPTCTP